MEKITAELANTHPADPANGTPFCSYVFHVSVFDQSGRAVKDAKVRMSAQGAVEDRVTNTVEKLHSQDFFTQFTFVPKKAGVAVLRFTSSDLPEISVEVDVPKAQKPAK